jgi:hypothetical protein
MQSLLFCLFDPKCLILPENTRMHLNGAVIVQFVAIDRNCAANNCGWEHHTRYGNTLRFYCQHRGDICSKEPSQCLPCRGRLVSLLVLSHCGVSPMPVLPQESPCISFAEIERRENSTYFLKTTKNNDYRLIYGETSICSHFIVAKFGTYSLLRSK